MQTLLYSQIRDIAERVRTNPAIRFWDEDEDGNLQELGEEHIVRYLNDFLPASLSCLIRTPRVYPIIN
jgi:hypothetical protein